MTDRDRPWQFGKLLEEPVYPSLGLNRTIIILIVFGGIGITATFGGAIFVIRRCGSCKHHSRTGKRRKPAKREEVIAIAPEEELSASPYVVDGPN
jgi:hypothetical protein